MATLQDLENAIDSLLGHPLGSGNYQLLPIVQSKAYEAYLFGLCLRAVRELGVTPVLRGIRGAPNPFIFRGGPGQIHSTHRNYGYAEFSMNGNEFEVHAGVEFRGTSGMTHELDVAVMRAEHARRCRRHPDDPGAASLVAGWECKFYATTLGKELGRQFVGLVKDMGELLQKGLCSNTGHPQLKLYFRKASAPFPHFELTPLNASNEDIFVNRLKGALKQETGL